MTLYVMFGDRDSHEHPAVDKSRTSAADDDYIALDTQTQGDQPQYDVIQLNERQKAHHQTGVYENAASSTAQ